MERSETVNSFLDKSGVATVIMNKPKVHNAFDDELIQNLSQAILDYSNNPNVRIIVISATGKSFSAGADLNWMKKMAGYSFKENLNDALNASKLFSTIASSDKLVIAKVNGNAFGGGVGIIASCDIAIGVETAIFSLSEVRLGLIPSMISPYVINAIGQRQASRYMLTGEKFTAKTAASLGLLHEVVPSAFLEEATKTLIGEILLCGPNAISECKKLIRDVGDGLFDEDITKMTAQRIAEIRGSVEAVSGMQAFLSKRKAKWAIDK